MVQITVNKWCRYEWDRQQK